MINEIMEYNKKFVENKAYEPYLTSKYPDKKLAILTCMDTRLIELLPAALGLKNGDAKIIKNAGSVCVRLIWIMVSMIRCFTRSIPYNSSSRIRRASSGSIASK